MDEFLSQIPEPIQQHIKGITRTSGLPDTEESVEKIAEAWLEKEKRFLEEIESSNMEEVEVLGKEDSKGAIVMTYSGSLVSIGPLVDNKRTISYASIELRQDVPHMLTSDDAQLAEDLATGQQAIFSNGPVQKTSPVFKIAVSTEKLSPEEEEEKLQDVTMVLTDQFVEVNKTYIGEES